MRLVVDSLAMESPGAVALQRELSAALARTKPPGASLLVLVQEGRALEPNLDFEVRAIAWGRGWMSRWQWMRQGLPALLRQEHADALFEMSGHLSGAALRVCGVVTTANNMLPFTGELLAQWPMFSAPRIKMLLLKQMFLRGLRLADAVVLHSEHAKQLMTERDPALRDKIAVVFSGIPPEVRLGDPPPPHPYAGRPYFLYLSTMQSYKNHFRLIEAYTRAARSVGESLPDLLIAGIPADAAYVERVRDAASRAGLGDRIRYLGALDRTALPAWIHHARGNMFPSLCETNSVVLAETFGMHGVLACSDIPPMNEAAGDAALLFDPHDTESISAAFARLANEPALRDQLRERAALRGQAFSWDECGHVIWAQARVARRHYAIRAGIADA